MQHSKSRMHERAGEENESNGCVSGMSSGSSDDLFLILLAREFARRKGDICRRERIGVTIAGRIGEVYWVYILKSLPLAVQ